MGDDFVVDAITQFLQGDQWLQPVNMFMESHKLAFVGMSSTQEAYSLQHHAIFVEFKDMAERLLEHVIQELGCDAHVFLRALEDDVAREAGGPKEEEVQQLVETLLSFDDFDKFCKLMQSYVETNAVPSIPKNSDDGNADGTTAVFDPKTYFASNEWILQEVVARSLLEAQSAGQLDADDAAYLPWATAILDMKAFYTEETPISPSFASEKGDDNPIVAKMNELQANLVRERLKVDLLVAQRLAEQNAKMRLQMTTLSKHVERQGDDGNIAAESISSSSDDLACLLERLDTIQSQIKAIKKRCFALKSISPQRIDEIYLFLKEKIHYKQDLALCESDISDFIFARITPQDAAIVPEMLQWLLLESKALELQGDIQARSFQSPRAEAKADDANDRWIQQWSDADQAYYYTNAVMGATQWEPPMSKDGEPILGYWDDNHQWIPFALLDASQQDQTMNLAAQSKDDAWPRTESAQDWSSMPWTPSVEFKGLESALESALSSAQPAQTMTASMFDVEASLQKVLQEHADESKKLELALQVEHARQTQEIQRRKAQRRKERKMKKSAADNSSETQSVAAPPPPVEVGPLSALSGCQINICLPEGGKLDLMSLLSQADERMRRERRGDGQTQALPASLHASSLRYLAEKVAPTSKLIEIEDV
ncbi:hypothetical protein AC1031_009333 [Aphanomyces cochlioides]|nr:hypothetical protein AC1031_009333 [Aphanomyces cochlioides]